MIKAVLCQKLHKTAFFYFGAFIIHIVLNIALINVMYFIFLNGAYRFASFNLTFKLSKSFINT